MRQHFMKNSHQLKREKRSAKSEDGAYSAVSGWAPVRELCAAVTKEGRERVSGNP